MYLVETEEVYVNRDGSAAVVCPHCGHTTIISAGKFKGRKRRVRMSCPCQSDFRVTFEFRRDIRKETDLPGYYTKLAADEQQGKMVVRNISVNGMGFDAVTIHNLSKGDKVKVKFTRDDISVQLDGTQVEIEREAVVRWVKDKRIGCEFMEPIEYDTIDAVSGYYLIP